MGNLDILLIIVAILLVSTKLMDVISTLKRITPTNPELNPLARWLMSKVGVRPAIWLVFALVVIIIGVATWIAFDVDGLFQIVFIVGGTVVSIVQAAVAYANWTQRPNFITRKVLTWFDVLSRLIHRR
jgi:hypothetical protein